jgi:hypothetical protein
MSTWISGVIGNLLCHSIDEYRRCVVQQEYPGVQTEFVGQFREASSQWRDRLEVEAKLMSELASKLTAACSLPEVLAAYQEWGNRRVELMAQDTSQILNQAQKFMQSSAQLMMNGQQWKGIGTST